MSNRNRAVVHRIYNRYSAGRTRGVTRVRISKVQYWIRTSLSVRATKLIGTKLKKKINETQGTFESRRITNGKKKRSTARFRGVGCSRAESRGTDPYAAPRTRIIRRRTSRRTRERGARGYSRYSSKSRRSVALCKATYGGGDGRKWREVIDRRSDGDLRARDRPNNRIRGRVRFSNVDGPNNFHRENNGIQRIFDIFGRFVQKAKTALTDEQKTNVFHIWTLPPLIVRIEIPVIVAPKRNTLNVRATRLRRCGFISVNVSNDIICFARFWWSRSINQNSVIFVLIWLR